MNKSPVPCLCEAKPALLEHSQHRNVVGKNFGDKFFEAGVTGEHNQMAHKGGANSEPLIFIDDCKGQFGCTRLIDDVPSSSNDHRAPFFLDLHDQRDVGNEINVHKESYFFR